MISHRTATILLLAAASLSACGDKSGPAEASASTASTADTAKASSSAIASGSAIAAPSPSASTSASAGSLPSTAPGALTGAYRHIASDCELVVVSDLTKVAAHPTFAKELMPSIERALGAKAKKETTARVLAAAKDLGVTAKSAQNLAVCAKSFATKPTFALALGTDLKPQAFQTFMEKLAEVDGKKETLEDLDGVKVLTSPKVTMGQLPDGTLALADGKAAFKSVIPTGDHLPKLGIDHSKELAVYVAESVIVKELRTAQSNGFFDSVKEIRATVDLTTNKAVIRATCESGLGAMKMQTMIAMAKNQLADEKLKGNPFGAADIVRSVDPKVDGNDLVLEAVIPPKTLEDAAKALAAEIDKARNKMLAGGT